MRAYLIAFLVGTALLNHLGCSQNEPQQTVEDGEIDVLPEMPETTLDVKPVSSRKVASHHVRLSKGDTFHFQKTIEQTLTADPGHDIESVTEQVELLMSLNVLKIQPKQYRIEVKFQGVRYQSQLGDREIVYDSRTDTIVPPEALPYEGLLNNSFEVYLEHNNQIARVEQYAEFLNRCLAKYPAPMRPAVFQQLGGDVEDKDELVAMAMSFLDESIALLPFGKFGDSEDPFPVGAKWSTTMTRPRPMPLKQTLNSQIQHISGDGKTAHVVIQGELNPLRPQGVMTADAVRTRILGGSITGSCSISLKTGMPKSCRIQKDLEIEIASLQSPPVSARKTVITSLEAWTPTNRVQMSSHRTN